jgi:hypothetical protein
MSSAGKYETVEAFVRLREREVGPEVDFQLWLIELWETWGRSDEPKIRWGRLAFGLAYLSAFGFVAYHVFKWVF